MTVRGTKLFNRGLQGPASRHPAYAMLLFTPKEWKPGSDIAPRLVIVDTTRQAAESVAEGAGDTETVRGSDVNLLCQYDPRRIAKDLSTDMETARKLFGQIKMAVEAGEKVYFVTGRREDLQAFMRTQTCR